MEIMNNNANDKSLLDFLVQHQSHWSFDDLKRAFSYHNSNYPLNSLKTWKYTICKGVFTQRQMAVHKSSIIELCRIVKKRLDDEKEILEGIKSYQEVN